MPTVQHGVEKMLPFITSQAVALSKAKRGASKSPANGQQHTVPHTGKGFFSRVLDALVESRKRQAAMEIERQRRLRGDALEK